MDGDDIKDEMVTIMLISFAILMFGAIIAETLWADKKRRQARKEIDELLAKPDTHETKQLLMKKVTEYLND